MADVNRYERTVRRRELEALRREVLDIFEGAEHDRGPEGRGQRRGFKRVLNKIDRRLAELENADATHGL